MKYRNREIEDEIWTEMFQNICVINGTDTPEFDCGKLGEFQRMIDEKSDELLNSARRNLGVRFRNLRIRVETHTQDGDCYAYSVVFLVWEESESSDMHKDRIEKEKRRIDKAIDRYERRKAEKSAAHKESKDEIAEAIRVLSDNGYTISKN